MPARRGRGSTLGLRIVAVALLVAVLVATIAAAIAINAVQRTAREANSTRLSQQADLLQVELVRNPDANPRLLDVLAGQGLSVVLVSNGAPSSTDQRAVTIVREAGLLTASATIPASTSVLLRGERWLIEARQIPGTSAAFAVVGQADEGAVATRLLLRRIIFAMLIGLGVAIPVALLLARVISQPLRRTVDATRALSAGRRDVRLELRGPAEVKEVAASVNQLADDLVASEARQQRFIASVSHELRTPLTAVTGLSEALADDIVPAAEVPQVGATIRSEAARLERLVADLLDLARVGADDFDVDLAAVNVGAVLADTERAFRLRCHQAGIQLRVDALVGPVWVRADERRLRQVLDGLVSNAIRVLDRGQSLALSAVASPQVVEIEVRDSGPGLTTEDYRVIFQPRVLHEKYRGLRPTGGAGLGLALAHGLVLRMGGSLTAGPAPEGGVRCVITLPVASGDVPHLSEPSV